jgi:hypothetical protein
MAHGESKFELILLFDRLKLEPKKLLEFLSERGQVYSYSTVKKYYGHYHVADTMCQTILKSKRM